MRDNYVICSCFLGYARSGWSGIGVEIRGQELASGAMPRPKPCVFPKLGSNAVAGYRGIYSTKIVFFNVLKGDNHKIQMIRCGENAGAEG